MSTLGNAYKVAVDLFQEIGEEAAHLASEKAEMYRRKGDEAEAVHWDHVAAFVTHLRRGTIAH